MHKKDRAKIIEEHQLLFYFLFGVLVLYLFQIAEKRLLRGGIGQSISRFVAMSCWEILRMLKLNQVCMHRDCLFDLDPPSPFFNKSVCIQRAYRIKAFFCVI